jgi:hypothetical protein
MDLWNADSYHNTTWHHKPEDLDFKLRCHENLKSHTKNCLHIYQPNIYQPNVNISETHLGHILLRWSPMVHGDEPSYSIQAENFSTS